MKNRITLNCLRVVLNRICKTSDKHKRDSKNPSTDLP